MSRHFGLVFLISSFTTSTLATLTCPGLLPDPSVRFCSSDPQLPTTIYHWTNDPLALADPTQYLINSAQKARKLNQELLCEPYKVYQSTQNESIKMEMLGKLIAPKLDAGFGVYFAEDPLTSMAYGVYLVELDVPPSTKCVKYDFLGMGLSDWDEFRREGYLRYYAERLMPYVLSDEGILVYPWTSSAVVIRDFSTIAPLSVRAVKMEYSKQVVEMYKLAPITENKDWRSVYQYYGSWISRAFMLINWLSDDFKYERLVGMSFYDMVTIADALNFEFLSNTPDILTAKSQMNLTAVSLELLPDVSNGRLKLFSNLDNQLTVDLLKRADYIPKNANFSIPIPELILEHFDAKNGTYNLMKMIEAFKGVRDNQIPRINTWSYISTSAL